MTLSRRTILQLGGLTLAGLPFAASAGPVGLRMMGNANGSEVWFDPIGIHVPVGFTISWRNDDPGNAHTTTAFHPRNNGHLLRIPAGAEPWDSDYLLPGETFAVTLTIPGVYDYFCTPHEMAEMVGRIVVTDGAVPAAAEGLADMFPPVAEILRLGRIEK